MKIMRWAVAVVSFGLLANMAMADGNRQAGLVLPNGNQYLYPTAQPTSPGGLVVYDANGGANWSNVVNTSTNAATVFTFPALPSVTLAQLDALQPQTTGQVAFCSNCTQSYVCVSTGSTTIGAWVPLVATGTFTAATFPACK